MPRKSPTGAGAHSDAEAEEAAAPAPSANDLRRLVLAGLALAFAVSSLSVVQLLLRQPAGVDFSAMWAGARTALSAPARLYDFAYVTSLQGWPLGPASLRPFIYPPSALVVFAPFAALPYGAAYGAWVVVTGALFAVAGRRAGAPWWFLLMPSVALVAFCGQVTFLLGALVLAGLTEQRRRPLLAGVLLGVAAAVKPQLLVLLPVALAAARDWRTLAASAVTGLALCAVATAAWGVDAWLEWLAALGRFNRLIFDDPSMVADAVTPYAALHAAGAPGALAFLLAPVVAAVAWAAFSQPSTSLADRTAALLGGALLISPYALNYELALLAPVTAIYLARTADRGWWGYAVAATAYVVGPPLLCLCAALSLPAIRLTVARPPRVASPATALAMPRT